MPSTPKYQNQTKPQTKKTPNPQKQNREKSEPQNKNHLCRKGNLREMQTITANPLPLWSVCVVVC